MEQIIKKNKLKYLAIIYFLFHSFALYPNTVVVCNDCETKTISKAIADSKANDTIVVNKGNYTESKLLINKPLTIIGRGKPIIHSKNGENIFMLTGDSIKISGLELIGVKRSFTEDRAAIKIDGGDNIVLEDNILTNTFFGIYIAKSVGTHIIGNTLVSSAKKEMNSANAIHAWSSKKLIVKDNYVSGHRDGLYFEFCDNSVIKNNYSYRNLRYGLHFMFSDNNLYKNNIFEENGAGVAVMYSHKIEMLTNQFKNNWGPTSYGLLLKEIKDSKIHYNKFDGNTKGIYGESVIRVNITHNDFSQNGWAMQMMGSSEQDTISYNNFLNNTFNVSTNQNARNYNIYSNNYWSDYSGYDLDKDGIGDVPHRPVKFFSQVLGYTPEAIILLRSFFIELLNFIENIIPVLTPENLQDMQPQIKKISHDRISEHT